MTAGDAAFYNGINVLLELAADRVPLSRSTLKERSGLSREQLDKTLGALSTGGFVGRMDGPRGRYYLARPAEDITVAAVHDQARPTGPATGGWQQTTLTDLLDLVQQADDQVCPYFEACAVLDAPEGPVYRSACAGGNGCSITASA